MPGCPSEPPGAGSFRRTAGKASGVVTSMARSAISGTGAGQQSFTTGMEIYMRDLKLNQHGLAELYTAFRFGDQAIVMNPAFSFGEPVIRENGYPADVLWRAVIAEGSVERAAEYDASPASVETAYRYCDGELGMAA
jgi:uncharacterized protein (DUF433 family)